MNNNRIFIEVDNLPETLPRKELLELLAKVKEGSKEAREQVANHNIRLVLYVISKNYSKASYDKQDLVSIGTIGLLKAIDTYDISTGAKFSTYAKKCIETEIRRFFRDAKELQHEVSINNAIFQNVGNRPITLEDKLYDDSNFVEDYETIESYKIIRELIEQLPEREREIIKLYYGFYNNKRYTQQEIADKFHITRQRIACILSTTIKKLGEQIKAMEDIENLKKVRVKKRGK